MKLLLAHDRPHRCGGSRHHSRGEVRGHGRSGT